MKTKLGHEALLSLNLMTQTMPKKPLDKLMAFKYTRETSEFEWLKKKGNHVLNVIVMEETEEEVVVEVEDAVVDEDEIVVEGEAEDAMATTDVVEIEKGTTVTTEGSHHMVVEIIPVTEDTIAVATVVIEETKVVTAPNLLKTRAMATSKMRAITSTTQVIITPRDSKPNSNTIHSSLIVSSSSKVTNLLKINITPNNSNKVMVKQILLNPQDTVNPQHKHINNPVNNTNPNTQQIFHHKPSSSNTIPPNLINNLKQSQQVGSSHNNHRVHIPQHHSHTEWHLQSHLATTNCVTKCAFESV